MQNACRSEANGETAPAIVPGAGSSTLGGGIADGGRNWRRGRNRRRGLPADSLAWGAWWPVKSLGRAEIPWHETCSSHSLPGLFPVQF
jgi:hypothetical protein